MPSIPKPSDFPAPLSAIISPSSPSPSSIANVVLFLHGLGDNATNFSGFAKALNLPETLTITLQGPSPLPLPLPQGYHWGDDITIDQSSGDLDPDAGFQKARTLLVEDVIKKVLIGKCGFTAREIMIFGFGQGGMVGLAVAKDMGQDELGGVISIGGALPETARLVSGGKSRTPVLLLGGTRGILSSSKGNTVKSAEGTFHQVEHHQWRKTDDSLPRSREEALPMMQYFARRLRSRKGVPEGAVEIGR